MIDPSVDVSAYRLFTRVPDSRFGLRMMHAMIGAQRFSRPKRGHVKTIDIERSAGRGTIKTWVVTPKNGADGNLPIVLHLHGGGYAIGAPFQDYALFDRYMAARPCIFVAPQYRRSFQSLAPAAVEDAHDALVWARDNANALGGRADKIFVMGESAGGGLTAGLSLMARDRGEVAIAAQFPIYAMLDDRNTVSSNLSRGDLTWSVEKNKVAWDLYLGGSDAPVSPYAAPTRAADLSGMPPSFGFIGDNDIFLQENTDYFARLEAAGVPTRFKVFQGAYHGAEIVAPDGELGQRIWDYATAAYAQAVDNCVAPQA